MKNKKKVILLVVSILGVIGIVFGLSYAWFTLVIKGQKVNTIQAGELTLSINETGAALNITDAYPITDEEGLKGTATTFSLTNTSQKNLEYKLKLVYDEASCSSCKKIPSSAVRYSLTKNGTTLDSANLGENKNIIESGIINTKDTYEYSLKIWINYNAGNEAMDAYFYGKLEIEAVQTNLMNATDESCFGFDSSTGTITKFICAPYTNNYRENGDTTPVLNTNSINNITDVIIPRQIGGVAVTQIGSFAFYGNQLTSVVIPDSITSIGMVAFNSNQLTNLIIPESVINIQQSAFENNQLTMVSIPSSLKVIDGWLFSRNKLTSVTIPEGVTSIGDAAFSYNELTSVIIPNTVTKIGTSPIEGAFRNNQLKNITIGTKVTSIEADTFYNNQLTTVEIPSSVTSIGNAAFGNNQLTSVRIKGKANQSAFTSYGENIWGWASGYSDANITWNG